MQPTEDIQRYRVVVAQVLFQNGESLDEGVAGPDFFAHGLLKLSQVVEGIADGLMLRAQLLFGKGDCVDVKAFRLFKFLPALVVGALLEQVGYFEENRAGGGSLVHTVFLLIVLQRSRSQAAVAALDRVAIVKEILAFSLFQAEKTPRRQPQHLRVRALAWKWAGGAGKRFS